MNSERVVSGWTVRGWENYSTPDYVDTTLTLTPSHPFGEDKEIRGLSPVQLAKLAPGDEVVLTVRDAPSRPGCIREILVVDVSPAR